MTSSSDIPIPGPDDDQVADPKLTDLVAYLDGELPPADSEKLEQQLVLDAPLRQCAESLDRTWQMLDLLEDATASGEFTRKTLSSIQTQPKSISSPGGSTLRTLAAKWSLGAIALWMLTGFIGTAFGLMISRQSQTNTTNPADAEILKDLDLLRNYQRMRQISGEKFLRDLAEIPLADTGSEK